MGRSSAEEFGEMFGRKIRRNVLFGLATCHFSAELSASFLASHLRRFALLLLLTSS